MSLPKTYCEKTLLLSRDCDLGGLWKPSAILTAMQETAGMHSHILGCGRETLVQKGVVWVLTRCEVQMEKEARMGSRLSIETFPMPLRRWFFPRYFLVEDESGRTIGKAATLWLLLDIHTRHMAPPDAAARCIPDNSDLTPPLGLPGNVLALPGAQETVLSRWPVYSDQHVNNARYADWACDALGFSTMREYCLKTMCIQYAAEIRPGQEISLHAAQSEGRYRVAGYHEGKMHFEIGGELMPRQR